MSYDPRAHGARCDDCSLKHCRPVPPEIPAEPGTLAIVGEAPGEEEEKQSRPFCGPSGRELDAALRAARIDRRSALTTNVILCRPEKNKLDVHLRKLKKQDDDRHKKAMEKWKAAGSLGDPPRLTRSPTPMECCKPRFEAEIEDYRDFITLGKVGTNAVTGLDGGILPIRGGVMELEPQMNINGDVVVPARRVMPTVHPAFVLRTPRWRHVFKSDVLKGARHFRGESKWVEPHIIYHPSPSQLEEFLFGGYGPYGCDVETDGIESLTAKLRCITIAVVMPDGSGLVHCIGVESIDKSFRYYPDFVWRKIVDILRRFFGDPKIAKTGHNFNAYDKLVLRNQLQIELANVTDGLILHKNVESELPHGLGYVGKLMTDVPEWKSDRENQKLSTHAASNEVLHKYGALDAFVSRIILEPLVQQVVLRDQVEVFHIDSQMQEICVEMHQNGMYVDQERRLKEERALLGRRHETLAHIRKFLGRDDFNPGSVQQLRELLFEDWGLVADLKDKDRLTESDDPSTGDLVLRTLLTQPGVPKDKRDFIKVLRRFRKIQKVIGTYVTKLRFNTTLIEDDLGWDEDEDWVDVETRKRYGVARTGITFPLTGRMHPGYNCAAVTGRLSSSKPMNCFDGETEVLTPSGWRRLDSLEGTEPVMQWDRGRMSFVIPSAFHVGDYEGQMIAIKNLANDLLVTDNHRLLFEDKKTGFEVITAERFLSDVETRPNGWYQTRQTVHAGVYAGPGLPLTLEEVRLLVAIQADGSWVYTQGKRYGISFGLAKERKQQRLEALLIDLGVEYSVNIKAGGTIVYADETKVRNRSESKTYYLPKVPAFVQKYLGDEKLWGAWLLAMSREQMDVFVEEIWHWDGCLERQSQYASTHKSNADWVSAVLALSGVTAKVRYYENDKGGFVWSVDAVHRPTKGLSPKSQVCAEPHRSTKVYCPTVPSGFILVRRHGRNSISGQSQNFPKGLRAMVVAAPGNVLVGADADQLELRVAAAHWGVEMYLRAFADGKDPHSMTAFAIFGEEFCTAAGIHPSAFSLPGKLVGTCYKDGAFDGVNANAMQMRNLSKAVQYACIAEDEHVIILGEAGSRPIAELTPGEWTWCWSRERKRYEPAEITAVVPRGQRECVRVSFEWWGGAKKGRCSGSVVVTTDHLCMLRDGSFREAGSLSPDDRLMPFRRRETGSERCYRRVMPFNDAREFAEHRVVKGFYENEPTHVHHEDEKTLNNNPNNLVCLSSSEHTAEHAVGYAAGRLASKKWRDSVSDSDTRKRASAKMWDNRRKEGRTRFGSVLDPFAARIGYESDTQIAKEAGVTAPAVFSWRKSRGIPAYWKEAPTGKNHRVVTVEHVGLREVWDLEVNHEDHNFPLAAGIFVHNSQYMGSVETVHQLIQKTEIPERDPVTGKPREDGTTVMPYALEPLSKTRDMREKWLANAFQFQTGWESEIAEYQKLGYLRDPVHGRRRDFLDGEDPNQIVNYKIQSGASALMNNAIISLHFEVQERRKKKNWGPHCGIINQCHDSIVLEVPEAEAEWAATTLARCMNQTHPRLPGVVFSAGAKIGKTWKEVG